MFRSKQKQPINQSHKQKDMLRNLPGVPVVIPLVGWRSVVNWSGAVDNPDGPTETVVSIAVVVVVVVVLGLDWIVGVVLVAASEMTFP